MFRRKKKPFKTIEEMREVLLDLEQRGFVIRRTDPEEEWMLHPQWADSSREEYLRAVEASYDEVP
jgi:hypothetical protein